MALRARAAFEPEGPRTAYVRGDVTPERMTPARERVLEVARTGWRAACRAWRKTPMSSPAVVRGLIGRARLSPPTLPEFAPFRAPDPDFATPVSVPNSRAAAALRAAVAARRFSANLLDGVTGSGKTETYFEAVAEALRRRTGRC